MENVEENLSDNIEEEEDDEDACWNPSQKDACILMKASARKYVKALGLDVVDKGDEIEVTVKQVPIGCVDGFFVEPDVELCNYFELKYDDVISIEII